MSTTLTHRQGHRESAELVSIDRILRERILEGLAKRGIRIAGNLTLDVHNRAVTVSGRVDSYYQRQLIVHSIRLVPGVGELTDAVECSRSFVAGGSAM
jgi:osmotically-inducible protein OsmY